MKHNKPKPLIQKEKANQMTSIKKKLKKKKKSRINMHITSTRKQ
jgi:hypothetical protein